MFEDLLNFSYLNEAASFSIPDIAVALVISFVLGLFIFTVYKKTFNGVMYSSSFAISLIAMGLITTLIILAVSTNLITSLGMVGALSIVRFRTVIKEPLDLVYLFWTITMGIIVGVGLIALAIIGSAVIGAILFFFVNHKSSDTPYVLVINCADESSETESLSVIKNKTKKHMVKSKSVSQNGIELTTEVRLNDDSVKFVNELLNIQGVYNAVLVTYNGDYYM
jgi:ABC-type spermidine/putrescine transport system permease subunit II